MLAKVIFEKDNTTAISQASALVLSAIEAWKTNREALLSVAKLKLGEIGFPTLVLRRPEVKTSGISEQEYVFFTKIV